MKPTFSEVSHIPVLKALSEAQFQTLVNEAQIIPLIRNQYLFHQGDVSSHFYYLISGQIKIALGTPQGNEKIIAIARPHELFAEAAMFLGNAQYPASASALEASEVLRLSSDTLIGFLSASIELPLAIIGNLSMRLHSQIIEIENLTLHNATFRLAYYIHSLMSPNPDGSAEAVFPAAKHAIASRLSITPETLSRSLHELDRAHLVQPIGKSRQLNIPSAAALQEYLTSHQQ